ncbi:nitrite reductase small subunit NirD [Kaarinaea lacus]
MLTETKKKMDWIEVGDISDIPRLGARVVNTAQGNVAVFRNASDEIFAVLDRCPHKGGPLSQGIVHGRSVTCPLHNWVLGLDDGMAKAPDEGCVKTYPVKVEDNIIFLMI